LLAGVGLLATLEAWVHDSVFKGSVLAAGVDQAISKERSEHAAMLVRNLTALAWESDASRRRCTHVGVRGQEFLSYAPDDWCGENFWFDHLHPDDKDEVSALCSEFTVRGEDHILEYRMVSKHGGIVWVRDSVIVVTDEEGSPVGLRGLFVDVTEEHRTQRELREINDRLSAFWTAARDGVLLVDEQSETVIEASPSLARLLGYPEEQMKGMPVWQLHQQDRELAQDTIEEVSRVGALRFEGTLVKADGKSRVPVEILSSRVTVGGKNRILSVVRDLSERQAAEVERQRLERQVLEGQRLEGLGLLAGGIAHDFNNLLTVILGNADMLLRSMDSEDAFYEPLQDLDAAAQRAAEVTHQMLAYSGRAAADIRIEDLSEISRETAQLLLSGMSKKVELSLDLSEAALWVEADAGQLHQVVMNMLTNAVEAIGDNPGKVRLATGIVESVESYGLSTDGREISAGRYAYVEISDDGEGMDEAVRLRMFEPFFTTKFDGRGLGLAAVSGIVRAHDGGIWVESDPGSGTRMQILFPLTDATPEAAEIELPVLPLATDRGPIRILVVDDESGLRRLVSRALERRGFDAVEARDGQEALDRVEADRDVGLVLLDLMMPGLSGLETLVRLQEIRPELPVVLMSGYAQEEILGKTGAGHARDFLHKPFRPTVLLDRIERVLGLPAGDDS